MLLCAQQSLLDAEPPGLSQQQQQFVHPDELLSQLQSPRPQVELQLGPQEVQVGQSILVVWFKTVHWAYM